MAKTDIIDWQACLELSNNNKDLAIELLTMLVNDLPDYEEKIRAAYAQHDIALIKHHLHKLHGACCYCGVPALRTLVKSAQEDIQMENLIPSYEIIRILYQQIDNVIEASEQFLQREVK